MSAGSNDSHGSMIGRPSKRTWARVGLGLTTGALVAGAAFALPANSPLGPVKAAASTKLTPFSDCDALRAWYIKQALPKVTAWGLGTGLVYPGVMFAAEDSAAVPMARSDVDTGAVGNGPTGTNVQEAGVDEPDLAKTMGGYVITTHKHTLVVTDVSGDEPEVVGTVDLPEDYWSYQLLVIGDRVVVMSDGGYYGGPIMLDYAWPYNGGGQRASITVVDLADPADPQVVDQQYVDGSISSSRSHDGIVRIVVTSNPAVDLPFVYPGGNLTRAEALKKNRAIVAGSTAADWLPTTSPYSSAKPGAGEPMLDCSDVSHPDVGAGLGTLTVMTLDPTDPAGIDATAISADGSLVYSSTDRLYVSTVEGGWDAWGTRLDSDEHSWHDPYTEIHAFDTSDDDTTYVASGEVQGVVPDQWAFSELDGLLRVATTSGASWNPKSSSITVLKEDDGALVPVGTVGGLGPDEQIQAVRWFGDLALVVTFRQVDPLYAVDLSDPTHPQVTDELKVTGFSGYLHPVGGDLILGIGQAVGQGGRTEAAQVSTFDIGDLTNLAMVDRIELAPHSYSPVQDESRAFTYLPDQGLALIPTTAWSRNSAGVDVVRVNDDGSLVLLQTIHTHGWDYELRSLPLEGGRVAIVENGGVSQVVDLG